MTDTAKPTPGPWTAGAKQADESVNVNSGILHIARVHQGAIANSVANAALIAEAGTVYHETSLTPRQLLEQRDELVTALRAAQNALTRCARPTDDDLKISTRDEWILCVDAESKARAALAEHGERV